MSSNSARRAAIFRLTHSASLSIHRSLAPFRDRIPDKKKKQQQQKFTEVVPHQHGSIEAHSSEDDRERERERAWEADASPGQRLLPDCLCLDPSLARKRVMLSLVKRAIVSESPAFALDSFIVSPSSLACSLSSSR